MAVVERKGKRGPIYWVATSWSGGVDWERSGTNRREAERLHQQRKREVKAGTFQPRIKGQRATIGTYAAAWLERRANRTASDDRQRLEDHVLSRSWFAGIALGDVTRGDCRRLVEELQSEFTLAQQKTVKNIWGATRTMLRDAHLDGRIHEDVGTLPRGVLRKAPKNKRKAYRLEDAAAIVSHREIAEPYRVLWTLLFCTGMREGEGCGRRWRDWDRRAQPLGSLDVVSQYGDEPLKTDNPRRVPVHPALAAVLEWWWREGWELYVGRKPTPGDFIVPNRSKWRRAEHHTKSSAYKAWRRSLVKAGVENLSLHSTRNSFITWARRFRANPDAIEVITHNAKGDMLDQYTDWQWEPLCEAVSVIRLEAVFDAAFDAVPGAAGNAPDDSGGAGNRIRRTQDALSGADAESRVAAAEAGATVRPRKRPSEAVLDANQSARPGGLALGLAYLAAVNRRAA